MISTRTPAIGATTPVPVLPPAWLPSAALVAVAVVWGVTFTVVDGTTATLPAPDLVAWRFGLAALALGLARRGGPSLPALLRARSLLLGALLGAGFLLQAWALTYTDALRSGFLTGLLVVLAPVAAWLVFRERLRAATWAGVALAAAGVGLLGFRAGGFGPGELLTLASAAVWGLHLVLMSRWCEARHAWDVARVQTGAVAALAALVLAVRAALPGSSPLLVLPVDAGTWRSVLFLALAATAGTMVLLSWGQSRVGATRAAVILTLEPAVSGLTATFAGSPLTGRVVVGGILLLAAMVAVELAGRRGKPGSDLRGPRPEPGRWGE